VAKGGKPMKKIDLFVAKEVGQRRKIKQEECNSWKI